MGAEGGSIRTSPSPSDLGRNPRTAIDARSPRTFLQARCIPHQPWVLPPAPAVIHPTADPCLATNAYPALVLVLVLLLVLVLVLLLAVSMDSPICQFACCICASVYLTYLLLTNT